MNSKVLTVAEVLNLCKSYGGNRALDSVSLTFSTGEIHAVIGENGAGKSTLVECMSGLVTPSSGDMHIANQPVAFGNPVAMRRLGMRVVHQHFKLVPEFSVRENLQLGLQSKSGVEKAAHLAHEMSLPIDLGARVQDLPIGVQQRIEILKAITTTDAEPLRVLILDEPTAVLSELEIAELFQLLRKLKDTGCAIVLIAHKLSEVLQIADTISVLRSGRLVKTTSRANTNTEELTHLMVGDIPTLKRSGLAPPIETILNTINISVRGDRGNLAVQSVDLKVAGGEVLGIGGVDGNGQIELAEALVGIRKSEGGEIHCAASRISYISQDRQRDGLCLPFPIKENLVLGRINEKQFLHNGFVSPRAVAASAKQSVATYDIRCESINQSARSLSGGNQQKVVLARELERGPNLLITVNPTRGLDLAATQFVRQKLIQLAEGGAAVIVFSTDHDELAEIATRRSTMVSGRINESLAEAAD